MCGWWWWWGSEAGKPIFVRPFLGCIDASDRESGFSTNLVYKPTLLQSLYEYIICGVQLTSLYPVVYIGNPYMRERDSLRNPHP